MKEGDMYTFTLNCPLEGNFIVLMKNKKTFFRAMYFSPNSNANVALSRDDLEASIKDNLLMFVSEVPKKEMRELTIAWKHNDETKNIAGIDLKGML